MTRLNHPSIFYPHHLDLWNPIHTIHRKLSCLLSENYHIFGFVDDGSFDIEGVKLQEISINMNRVLKYIEYFISYSRDYNIVHTGPSPRHKLARLTKIRGASVVHTLHSTPTDQETIDRQQRLSNQADVVTAVSPYVKNWAIDELGLGNIYVIPNGVDLNHFHPDRKPTNDGTILYIGRFIDRKNPELVIELAKQLPEYTVKMRGGSPTDINKPIPDNVEILGYLSESELADLYARSQCLLCPFEREGFGMVIIEAMASGTPVIGLNDGNIPNLINKSNGRICESTDVDEWVANVENVCNSKTQYSPRSTITNYSWGKIASKYDKIYQRVV